MMRTLSALVALAFALLVATPVASGQPGAEAPPPEELPGADDAPPAPVQPLVAPAQLMPRDAVVMSAEERELVLRGEISGGRWIAGGVVSYLTGFGIGHAVQHRWLETGWIFTVGEAASAVVLFAGLPQCIDDARENNCSLTLVGLAGLAGFRIWELIDVWAAPPLHNREVRRIRAKYNLDRGALPYRARLHLMPARGGGMTGGFSLSF